MTEPSQQMLAKAAPVSVELRANMIADAIGQVSQGDCRKRVFDAAADHIRAAIAQDREARP